MEGKRDHGLDAGKVDDDRRIIIGALAGFEFAAVLLPAVQREVLLRLLVRLPDGGKAGRLRRHDVDAVPEIHGKIGDAGADEFQDLILDEALRKGRLDEGERHVLRADALSRLALQVHGDDLRARDVVRLL